MSRVTQMPPDLLTIPQAAERLGISRTSAWRRAKAGELPGAFKIGALWRVSVVKLDRFIHGDTAHGSPDRPSSGARADVAPVTADGSGGGTDGRETRSSAQPVRGATEPRSLGTSPVVPSPRVATPKRGPAEREHSEGEGQ